ncbi:hypothetical protein [Pandoravirus japonicus]|uniref:Uncharacterized protein n=1 Tax=Pandoravirus japonicus TaxID=2823154 RepID=A0A811BR55_9VIRU|nr:hypothetical protein [Pandoravirus japonicus]
MSLSRAAASLPREHGTPASAFRRGKKRGQWDESAGLFSEPPFLSFFLSRTCSTTKKKNVRKGSAAEKRQTTMRKSRPQEGA